MAKIGESLVAVCKAVLVEYFEQENFYLCFQVELAQIAHKDLVLGLLEGLRASLGFSHIAKLVAFVAVGFWAGSGMGLTGQIDSASVCFAAGRDPAVVRRSPRKGPAGAVAANTVVDMLGFGSAD